MGSVCAAKSCLNKRYLCKKSFFRFPTDHNRARLWVIACSREELLNSLDSLHKSHRLCQDHFVERMFTNKYCNRLNPNAVPTLFPLLEGSSRRSYELDHAYTPIYGPPKLIQLEEDPSPPDHTINILEDVVITPGKTPTEIELNNNMDREELILSSPELRSSSTQTTSDISFNMSRKRKYRDRIRSLKRKNDFLKKRILELEQKFENVKKNISLEQYYALTYKFYGNSGLTRSVNSQVSQSKKNPKSRR